MEEKREEIINDNGSHTIKTVRKVTKEDGWVDVDKVFSNNHEPKNKLFKGKGISYVYETDDPRITRPIVKIVGFCLLAVGIIMSVVGFAFQRYGLLFYGVILTITIISFLVNQLKAIKEIEEKQQSNLNNNNKNM